MDSPQQCFFNARLHTNGLRPGGQVRLRTPSGKYTNVVGEVLEFRPPYRYAHTFRFTTYDDPPCRVVYDLKAVEGGVEFTLTVLDIPKGTKTAKDMQQGGTMIVNTLKAIIEKGRPALGTRLLYGMFKVMEPVLPKRCKSEHWPLSA
jgi:uncharacterized protein YndB with AHSA1/START domain